MSTIRSSKRPRRMLGATAVMAAFTLAPVLAATAAGAAPTNPATIPTHSMSINGTALSSNSLNVISPDGATNAQVSTGSVQTLDLEEGTYSFNEGGAANYCTPTVTTAGTWSVPSSCGPAVSGNGTSTLVLSGIPVTLDATTLSTGLLPLVYGSPFVPAGQSKTLTLMPSPGFEMVIGSSEVTSCTFSVSATGTATTSGCGAGATASGADIDFSGLPVAIDARQLSTDKYYFPDAINLDFLLQSSATVNTYHLLPAEYAFGVSGAVPQGNFAWSLNSAGTIGYVAPADKAFLAGTGTSTLVVKGVATTVDASSLGSGSFSLGSEVYAPSFPQATAQDLHLVPGLYQFSTTSSSPAEFAWNLTLKDHVTLVKPFSCAYAAGRTLTVDCSPPTFTNVSGAPNSVTRGDSFVITGVEGDRVADVHATGTLTFTDETTHVVLGRVALTPTSFDNSSEAQTTDTEALAPGRYTIKAVYTAGGAMPIPASMPGTYVETVAGPA